MTASNKEKDWNKSSYKETVHTKWTLVCFYCTKQTTEKHSESERWLGHNMKQKGSDNILKE